MVSHLGLTILVPALILPTRDQPILLNLRHPCSLKMILLLGYLLRPPYRLPIFNALCKILSIRLFRMP
ncbi:hypothetical protein LINPERHAP2_LOCUS37000 [Linum perenne]